MTSEPFCGECVYDGPGCAGADGDYGSDCVGGSGSNDDSGSDGNDIVVDGGSSCSQSDGGDGRRGRGGGGSEELPFVLSFQEWIGFSIGRDVQE